MTRSFAYATLALCACAAGVSLFSASAVVITEFRFALRSRRWSTTSAASR